MILVLNICKNIYNNFKDNLIEKIKKKFKNHSYKEMYINI